MLTEQLVSVVLSTDGYDLFQITTGYFSQWNKEVACGQHLFLTADRTCVKPHSTVCVLLKRFSQRAADCLAAPTGCLSMTATNNSNNNKESIRAKQMLALHIQSRFTALVSALLCRQSPAVLRLHAGTRSTIGFCVFVSAEQFGL